MEDSENKYYVYEDMVIISDNFDSMNFLGYDLK